MDPTGRIDRIRRGMAERGIDLVACSPGDDLRYLLGYTPTPDERPCYLLISPGGAAFVVPELNAAQAAAHVRLPTFTYSDAEGPRRALEAAREVIGGTAGRLAVTDTMRADFVLTLLGAYPGAQLLLASEILAPLRMRKSPEEVDALRRSSRHADQAMRDAWAACRVGATEREIAEVAAASFKRSGSEEVLFTLVASGPNGAFPHHHVTDRRLEPGDAVTIDVGGRLGGYASDLTRMAFVGPPTARYLEVHRTVEAAVEAALAAIRPGVPVSEVDRAARAVIERAGFGPYFTHRTGHGIGLSGHEPPSVSHSNPLPIDVGFVFTVEPGIYLPGEFGVRLEDVVYVGPDGVHVLSQLPREVHVVPAG